VILIVNVITEVSAPPPEAAPPGILDQILSLWWLYLLILVLLGVILFFIIRWLLKIKEDEDEVLKLYKERKNLCKQHRTKKYYHAFFRKEKNAPINCLWQDASGKWQKKTVGYYYGDYYGKEGVLILAFAKMRSNKWLIFPDVALLILNKNPKRTITYKDRNGDSQSKEQEFPTQIEEFLDDEIVLKCVSIDKLDRESRWFAPVLQDANGKIINPTAYAFEQFKDVFLGEYLLTNMNDALQQSKKALDMNQWIRGKQKLDDKSQSVEQQPPM
jgi:hypothetical protein